MASPWFLDTVAVVQLGVLRCTGLRASDINLFGKGKSDPYVQLRIGDQPWVRTSVLHKTLSPRWEGEVFYMLLPSFQDTNNAAVSIEVYDWDRGRSNDFLGGCEILVAELQQGTQLTPPQETGSEVMKALYDPKHGGSGTIVVQGVVRRLTTTTTTMAKPIMSPDTPDSHLWRNDTPPFTEIRRMKHFKLKLITDALKARLKVSFREKASTASLLKANAWDQVNLFNTTHTTTTDDDDANNTNDVNNNNSDRNNTKSNTNPSYEGCRMCAGECAEVPGWGWVGVLPNDSGLSKDGGLSNDGGLLNDSGLSIAALTPQLEKVKGSGAFKMCDKCWGSLQSSSGGVREVLLQQTNSSQFEEFQELCGKLSAKAVCAGKTTVEFLNDCEVKLEHLLGAKTSPKDVFEELVANCDTATQQLKTFRDIADAAVALAKKQTQAEKNLPNRFTQLSNKIIATLHLQINKSIEKKSRCMTMISWLKPMVEAQQKILEQHVHLDRSRLVQGVLLVTIVDGHNLGKPTKCALTSVNTDTISNRVSSHGVVTSDTRVQTFEQQFEFLVYSQRSFKLRLAVGKSEAATFNLYQSEYESNAPGVVSIFDDRHNMHVVIDKEITVFDGHVNISFSYKQVLPITRQRLDDPLFTLNDVLCDDVSPAETRCNSGLLFLATHGATGLPATDRDGVSDPYCVASILKDSIQINLFKTQVDQNTIHPHWDSVLHEVSEENDWRGEVFIDDITKTQLKFKIWDANSGVLSKDTKLARIVLPITHDPLVKETVSLGDNAGEMTVSMIFRPVLIDTERFISQSVWQKIHHSKSSDSASSVGAIKGKLTVTIHRAEHINPHNDARGKLLNLGCKIDDFYVKVRVGEHKFKTKVCWNSMSPVWDEQSPTFQIKDVLRESLQITVKVGGKFIHDSVASVCPLYESKHRNITREWLPLNGDEKHGRIQITLKFQPE